MKHFYTPLLSIATLCLLLTITSCSKYEVEYENYSDLSGTSWVISRFDNTLTNMSELPNDTIHFLDADSYRINNGTARKYSLWRIVSEYETQPSLSIYNCITFGGTFTASFDLLNIDEGEVNNKLFSAANDNRIVVWMHKIN